MKKAMAAVLSLYFVVALFLTAGRVLLSAADQAGNVGSVVDFWERLRSAGGIGFGTAILILAAIGGLALGWDGIRKQKQEQHSQILNHRGLPFDRPRGSSLRSFAFWASICAPPVLIIVVVYAALVSGASSAVTQRSLTQEQRDYLVAALKAQCPFEVAVRPIPGNAEGQEYGDQLAAALRAASCTVGRPIPLIDSRVSYGLTVAIHNFNQHPRGADALVNALLAAGIPVIGTEVTAVEEGKIYLMVGAPSPRSASSP